MFSDVFLVIVRAAGLFVLLSSRSKAFWMLVRSHWADVNLIRPATLVSFHSQKSMTFSRRVCVMHPVFDREIEQISARKAERAVAAGLCTVHLERNGVVIWIRQVAGALARTTDAAPGSYGIDRQHLDGGHICFAHRRTWARALACSK